MYIIIKNKTVDTSDKKKQLQAYCSSYSSIKFF